MIKISIITISYNSCTTIKKTIESVLAQDYPFIEYIIVDGASTDCTMEIVKSYEDKISKVLCEPDKGISDAFNKGLKFATGDLIAFLNADDYYKDVSVINRIADNYVDINTIICGAISLISNNGEILKTLFSEPEKLKEGMYVRHPATFIPKELVNKVGEFNLDNKIAMDFEFMSRCIKFKCKFKPIPDVITMMLVGGASFDTKRAAKEELDIKNRYYGISISNYLHYYISLLINKFR